jgi:hypothetical protein
MIGLGIPMLSPLAPWPWRFALCAPVVLIIVVTDTRRSVLGYARVGLSGLLPRRSTT